jgi:hypothetical protein
MKPSSAEAFGSLALIFTMVDKTAVITLVTSVASAQLGFFSAFLQLFRHRECSN